MHSSPDHEFSSHPSRRKFLSAATAGGLAAAVLSASGLSGREEEDSFELSELSISDLQEGIKSGKYTSRFLVEKYLARIEAIDRKGPALPQRDRSESRRLGLGREAADKGRKAKGSRGPLHGIPVLIKDNIATADRMETTAGSLALVGTKPATRSWWPGCDKLGRRSWARQI